MSERSLFDVRYTFPGYTFLLFTFFMFIEQILINYTEPKFGFFSVIFGFIYLLSGAPIGYFVSQIWYLYFHHWKKGYYWNDRRKTKKKEYVKYLTELVDDEVKLINDNPDKTLVILDYMFNISKDREKLRSYITRRWDLYHIMGSTEVSIIFGILTGILLKPYFIIDKFTCLNDGYDFLSNYVNILFYNFTTTFYIKDIVIFIFGILLFWGFQIGKKRISHEHEDMVDILIRNVNLNELRKLKENLKDRSKEYFKEV